MTSLGAKFDAPDLREEAYRDFVERNRQQLLESKIEPSFLDLKLDEVKRIMHQGEQPYKLTQHDKLINSGVMVDSISNYTPKLTVHTEGSIRASLGTQDDIFQMSMSNISSSEEVLYDEGGQDKLVLTGATPEQLWFQRDNEDLKITHRDGGNPLVIRGWFHQKQQRRGFRRRLIDDPTFQIEEIQTEQTGQTLVASQVNRLVDAMAAFNPPTGGEISLTPEQQTNINAVIAAS